MFRTAKKSLNTVKSESDDEEDYGIQRNSFRAPVYGPKPANFLGSLHVALQHEDWKLEYTGNYCMKEEGDGQLWEHMTIRSDPHDPNTPDNTRQWRKQCFSMSITRFCFGKGVTRLLRVDKTLVIDEMLTIKLYVAGTDEEIFISEAWTRAFNIDELIYSELCHNFYSTYEFDKVCADDELRTKKIINFRLCGRAFSGLRSDERFNAQDYWLSISREENLSLSRSHASIIRKPVLRLLSMFEARRYNGYANVAWLIARWMNEKGVGSQKESMICCGQFITKIAKRKNLLSDEVLNSLSALIYYRALDTTTLRELIDSKGRLIPEVPEPGVPRVAIPRPPRASMQDLYERMGSMKICQGAIERMSYRQSYQLDIYAGVFEHMAGVYDVPLQEAYNPPGYDQQQYD
ncbi:hypothetical protein Tco_0608731 [Tanacetum coccineum]